MSVPPNGNYSEFVNFSEEKRYYVMAAQKNVPILDAEVREMNENLLTLLRRSVQRSYGDLAAPTEFLSSPPSDSGTNNAFKITQSQSNPINNFTIKGGSGLENPAVIFYKGFYIFFKGDIEYEDQNDDLDSNINETLEEALKRDSYTKTPRISLSKPGFDRTDCVYIDLSFAEVSAEQGSEYYDPKLEDPVVGSTTQNRYRAVIDIKVKEGWEGATDQAIFEDPFFGKFVENQIEHYRFPISLIYREANDPTIQDRMIKDLLFLHDKRVYTNKELTHRTKHGGYTQVDVDAGRATVDDLREDAGATGANEGLGTEAYNTDSVTPRVLQNEGKFKMSSLLVGDTGSGSMVSDPEELVKGEVSSSRSHTKQLQVNSPKGITGARDVTPSSVFYTEGTTGAAIFVETGESGTPALRVGPDSEGTPDLEIDHRGFLGIKKGDTGPLKSLDVGDESNFDKLATFQEDIRVKGHAIGDDWDIPDEELTPLNPAKFGIGVTGSMSSVHADYGVATRGVDCTWGNFEGFGTSGQLGYSIGRGNSCTGAGPLKAHMDGDEECCFEGSEIGFTGCREIIDDVRAVDFDLYDANLFSFNGPVRYREEAVFQGDAYFSENAFVDGVLQADEVHTANFRAKRILTESVEYSVGTAGPTTMVNTIEELRSLAPGEFGHAYVFGYDFRNDGGEGWFSWDETATANDDLGFVIQPDALPAVGRWRRIFVDRVASLAHWGATNETVGNTRQRILNAQDFVSGNQKVTKLIVPTSTYSIQGDLDFTGDYYLEVQPGAKFVSGNGSTYTVSINTEDAQILGSREFGTQSDNINFVWNPESNRDAVADWWGAGRENLSNINAVGRVIFSNFYNFNPNQQPSGVTIERAHFINGCTISTSSTLANVTFVNATADKSAENIFIGNTYSMYRFEGTEVAVKWFSDILTDSSKYESMLISVTAGGAKEGSVVWDKEGVMTCQIGYVSFQYPISTRVEKGTLVDTRQNLFMGHITNGSGQIFEQLMNGSPIISGSKLLLSWFGTSFNRSSFSCLRNKRAIASANAAVVASAESGFSVCIEGEDAKLFFADDIYIASDYELRIKNLTMETVEPWEGSDDTFIDIRCRIDFDNVNIVSGLRRVFLSDGNVAGRAVWRNSKITSTITSTSGITFRDYQEVNLSNVEISNYSVPATGQDLFVARIGTTGRFCQKVIFSNCVVNANNSNDDGIEIKADGQIRVDNCEFNAGFSTSEELGDLSTARILLSNSSFSELVRLSGSYKSASNCRFSGFVRDYTRSSNQGSVFKGNCFTSGLFISSGGATEISDVLVSGNAFDITETSGTDYAIRIQGDSSQDALCRRVTITDNIVSSADIFIFEAFLEDTGHIGCKVYGNTVKSTNSPSVIQSTITTLIVNNAGSGDIVVDIPNAGNGGQILTQFDLPLRAEISSRSSTDLGEEAATSPVSIFYRDDGQGNTQIPAIRYSRNNMPSTSEYITLYWTREHPESVGTSV
jgi:hypothetical protein